MKQLTCEMLKEFKFSTVATDSLPHDWQGTVVDFLSVENISFGRKLRCALRQELVSEMAMRLFAVWVARQAIASIESPDPAAVACADAAESYAHAEIELDDLAKLSAFDVADYACSMAAAAASPCSINAAFKTAVTYSVLSGNSEPVQTAMLNKLIELIEEENL